MSIRTASPVAAQTWRRIPLDLSFRTVAPILSAVDGVFGDHDHTPGLTAERFCPDPVEGKHGSRLYRTGDLARCLPDGNLEFCGRVDSQIKINGFRIEPGEIESAIARHSQIREVAVLPSEDTAGDRRLIAYIVPASEPSSTAGAVVRELRSFLGSTLPQHMIPSAFVVVPDSLPLNASGKIDRERLPTPGRTNSELSGGYVKPRDPLQYQLRQIWEDLFDSRPIGMTDSFFDLGGHSLLWVRMMDRLEREFGKTLQLGTLFAGATIEYLAAALKQEAQKDASPLLPIQREGDKPPFYYLHGDFNGGGLYCRNLARHLGMDRPFYALQPHGCDGRAMPKTIEAMAEDNVKRLRDFQPEGPYLLGGHCNGALVAFEMARQLQRERQRVDQLVLICATATNARYRYLRSAVNHFCAVRGLGPDAREAIFLRMRAGIIRLQEIENYYTRQVKEASRLKTRDQVALVSQKARSGVKLLARLWSRRVFEEADLNCNAAAAATLTVAEERRRKINEVYERAIASYVPRKYLGHVILLQPIELMPENSKDPALGWRHLATSVEVRTVPGGHLSCITDHVEELAACLRDCLNNPAARKTFSGDRQTAATVPARG